MRHGVLRGIDLYQANSSASFFKNGETGIRVMHGHIHAGWAYLSLEGVVAANSLCAAQRLEHLRQAPRQTSAFP
jgi:hypothetical protein